MDLEAALRHAAELLTAGGRLLVVGLARPATSQDLAWDLASSVLNPLVGVLKHPHALTRPVALPFPVATPGLTFDQVSATATRCLPGARLSRRLFFRYTMEWDKR